ncbi:MAG: type II toxin-antitoxin system PemK/MazF family toxin [Coriobacteriia bacterium]|nr:type II toxin-antitoxin system PemK/MazF family toxin [Coriobacteriia bacterium]
MTMLIEQGDIIEADFDPTKGHEPSKRRPALVMSVGHFNNVLSSLTVVCPITSVDNGHPLHVPIASGNSAFGFICIEQLRAIDLLERNCTKLDGKLDEDTMAAALEATGAVFGI